MKCKLAFKLNIITHFYDRNQIKNMKTLNKNKENIQAFDRVLIILLLLSMLKSSNFERRTSEFRIIYCPRLRTNPEKFLVTQEIMYLMSWSWMVSRKNNLTSDFKVHFAKSWAFLSFTKRKHLNTKSLFFRKWRQICLNILILL